MTMIWTAWNNGEHLPRGRLALRHLPRLAIEVFSLESLYKTTPTQRRVRNTPES
jgi:hypothetical protein